LDSSKIKRCLRKTEIQTSGRNLNEFTANDKFPIPRMDKILDKLGRCQYFTTIDLTKEFHQIQREPESIAKTAFSTNMFITNTLECHLALKTPPLLFKDVCTIY